MAHPRSKLIVLGAGPPHRGTKPAALIAANRERRVFDLLLEATKQLEPEILFVGGYEFRQVAQEIKGVTFVYNPDWDHSGSASSLLAGCTPTEVPVYVCYSDIIFRPEVVSALRDAGGDIAAVIDTAWQQRYEHRSQADMRRAEKVSLAAGIPSFGITRGEAEFIGLLKLSPAAVEKLMEVKYESVQVPPKVRSGTVPDLLNWLIESGLACETVDANGHWAELNAPQDIARFLLGTKADTLGRLRPLLRRATILDQVSFDLSRWQANPEAVLAEITAEFAPDQVIVRSSASDEDRWHGSQAGAYLSVPNVSTGDAGQMRGAVDAVFSSYGSAQAGHQVLVQEMVRNVVASGVVLTRTLTRGAPYFSINFDDTSGATDTVTSGSADGLHHLLIFRNRAAEIDASVAKRWPFIADLISAVDEVEMVVNFDRLDIEFAVTSDGRIHFFQIRPMPALAELPQTDADLAEILGQAERTYLLNARPRPRVFGEQPIYGIMPDWNPAEIIGTKPRALAESLYRYLVTDETWAIQRYHFGYRDLRSHPLLISFAGHPYVDARASLNSFIPASLPDELAARLASSYLDRLRAFPELHDKIEFDVAFTCLAFDFEERAQRLLEAGFNRQDIEALRAGLERINRTALSRYVSDLKQIEELNLRLSEFEKLDLPPLEKAMALLQEAKWNGVLPFAHLARCAFVAVSLLRSATHVGLLREPELDAYLASVHTVARDLPEQGARAAHSEQEFAVLVQRFGHLRPGTYEITSPKYADDVETYLRPLCRPEHAGVAATPFQFSAEQVRLFEEKLPDIGLPRDMVQFDGFARAVIEGREYAKFVFTRFLSMALDLIAEFGSQHGVSRQDMSHIPLGVLTSLREGSSWLPPAESLKYAAAGARETYERAQAIELPPLITGVSDLTCFLAGDAVPNFVTGRKIEAQAVVVATGLEPTQQLSGRIVLIERADPGYDWLFGHNIAGLVTAYGGANSHMAIRCAEFGLPAAIGVGETRFAALSAAKVLLIDCAARELKILR